MPLLAQATDGSTLQFTLQPLLEDHGIPLAIMGIIVVFGALVLVSAFISMLPRLMGNLSLRFPEKQEHQPAVAKKPAAKDELPEETLVVIAAAVAEMMSTPHRIVRIRGLTPEDLGWSRQGRGQLHSSHRIPRRDRR